MLLFLLDNRPMRSFIFYCLGIFCVWTQLLADGKELYFQKTCFACHGMNGEGNENIQAPALASQERWYVISQLKKFKDKLRGHHPDDIYGKVMYPTAISLTEEEVRHLSEYLSQLPPVQTKQVVGGIPDEGAKGYSTCLACHGDKAQGNKAFQAPKLLHLQDWYIYRQVQNFKKGYRGGDAVKDPQAASMRAISLTISDDTTLKNIVTYIKSLAKEEGGE